MIKVRDLNFSFVNPDSNEVTQANILSDISFEIDDGECLGVVGVNGAGKSSLLRVLGGVFDKSSGEVISNRPFACLFELGSMFFPHLSGKENILFIGRSLLGLNEAQLEELVRFVCEFSEIPCIDGLIHTYSSGMKARLAFSIAVSQIDRNYLIDEALSVGDQLFQAKSFSRIQELKQNGSSIIFVSHDLRAIESVCERMAVVHNGQIFAIGDVKTVSLGYLTLLSDLGMKARSGNAVVNPKLGLDHGNEMCVYCTIADSSGQSRKEFRHGEHIFICLEIEAQKTFLSSSNFCKDSFCVGIGIINKYGQKMVGVNTLGLNKSVDFVDGRAYIQFSFQNFLAEGDYSILCSAHSGIQHYQRCYFLDGYIGSFSSDQTVGGGDGFLSLSVDCKINDEAVDT